MSTKAVATAWYRGMVDLCARGMELPGPGNPVLESAWQEFENLAAVVDSPRDFRKQGPRLAASLAEEALARHDRGIDGF